jgi:Protein of unknown function (DUF664)
VADGSGRDAVPDRWTATGADYGMWMDMALDPRFAAWTEPEGERATLLEHLRRYRLTMEMKCADLDANQLASRSVPPSTMSLLGLIRHMADMVIVLYHSQHGGAVRATILVSAGGGPGTVEWSAPGQPSVGTFALSPKVGDRLAANIFYDQNGHTILTATDITQGITKTVRITTGSIVYNAITLFSSANNNPPPPAADTRIWKVADTRQTTYTGTHGTVTGPWQTSPRIATTDGTATGKVVLSPSALWNQGQNFGIWLRHR